jgi:hypothetical protein
MGEYLNHDRFILWNSIQLLKRKGTRKQDHRVAMENGRYNSGSEKNIFYVHIEIHEHSVLGSLQQSTKG